MNEAITKVTAQDSYVDALTLGPSFYAVKVFVHVDTADNAVCQFATGDVGNWSFGDREYLVTESLIVKGVIGVRFRNYTPGAPAIVSAYLLTPSDPDFEFAVPLTAPGGGGGGSGVTGDIVYSAASSRAGALLCDGSTYDGTQAGYLALWNAIGLTYGGSGQNAFKVPDLRDRVPVGAGGNTTLAANEGIVPANRVNTRHRHTVTITPAGFRGWVAGAAVNENGDTGSPNATISGIAATVGANVNDPLDGPGFLGLNPFILL